MNNLERSPTADVADRPRSEIQKSQEPMAKQVESPPRKAGKGAKLLGVGVLAVLLGALAIGYTNRQRLDEQVAATSAAQRDFVPSVRTARVSASSPTIQVSLPGTTEAFAQADIYARASGYISKRQVDIGSRVAAGDLLVEISAPELDHQIAQAEATLGQLQAGLEQAKANRDLARITWDRDKPLVAKGWATPQQGDTDRLNLGARDAAVDVAQSNVTAQEAQLKVLQQQKAYQSVTAPFDGVITRRNVDVGALVQADAASGTFLFNLMNSDMLRIQLDVPQAEAFGLGPGVEAIVRVPEMPGRQFAGKVARVADAFQTGTRTLRTEIDVPNKEHELSPGIYCTIELKIPRRSASFVVPSSAIIFNQNGLSVAVVADGIVRLRPIAIARDFGTSVEVNEGVKDGDLVVLNPPVDLADGQKVAIRPEQPAPKPS
jgi:RND family efflux transporter MFP subunit